MPSKRRNVLASSGKTEAGQQVFTSSGSFQVPVGIYAINAVCVGRGGGGAGGTSDPAGGGGGGGALAYSNNISVSPGEILTITVPTSSGGGSAGGGAGSTATPTSIKRGVTTLVEAVGGSGGTSGGSGAGGSAASCTGDVT